MNKTEKKIVLTLDAGGTNFVFSAICDNEEIVEPVVASKGWAVRPLKWHASWVQNVVVCDDPQWSPHLAAGFALRCFQRLSRPDADTRRCTWRHNR